MENAIANAVRRNVICSVASLALIAAVALPVSSQLNPVSPDVRRFFQQNIGLTQQELASIQGGSPVTKALPSRTPAEVFLFGAVYINAAPESYIRFAQDFDRLRKLPNYLSLGVLSSPPQLSDFKNFSFDNDDIKALQNCKPGDCDVQMPASSIEELRRSINWSGPNAGEQVNQRL